jgi:ketosteroid isomerase-like protein
MHSPLQTINDHYQVIINKDVDGICSKYYPSEDTYVILEGPRLTTTGFEKIKKGWTDFCASSINLESIEWIQGPFVEEQTTMAWVAGIIKLKIAIENNSFENIFRATFVLVKHNDEFVIKHEHVSVVHADPYGIGDWSAKK